jgi:uncharacterized protein (DUF2345 family)
MIRAGKKPERPAAGRRYEITLPNGEVITGNLDAGGRARIDGIDEGTCKVEFPTVDPERWARA